MTHPCPLCGQPYNHAWLALACIRAHRTSETAELEALWDCE